MGFRRIKHEDKVNAFMECIEIKNTKEISAKYGMSERTLLGYCNVVLDEADKIIKKKAW